MSLDPRGAGAYVFPPRGDTVEHTWITRITTLDQEMFVTFNGGGAGSDVIDDPGAQLAVPYLGGVARIVLTENHPAAGATAGVVRCYWNKILFKKLTLAQFAFVPLTLTVEFPAPSPSAHPPQTNLLQLSMEYPTGTSLPASVWGTLALDQERD